MDHVVLGECEKLERQVVALTLGERTFVFLNPATASRMLPKTSAAILSARPQLAPSPAMGAPRYHVLAGRASGVRVEFLRADGACERLSQNYTTKQKC